MLREKCSLCGGKIVDGRCKDCGLRVKRSQDKNLSTEDKKVMPSQSYQAVTDKPVKKNKDVSSKKKEKGITAQQIKLIIAVVMILIAFGPFVISAIKEKGAALIRSNSHIEETDPYEYVSRELSETGEHFEAELEQGAYIIGVHIPEGTYTISVEEGDGNAYSRNYEQSIYEMKSLGNDAEIGEIKTWDDARLYQDGILEISGNIRIKLTTENGQNSQITAVENSLKEKVLLRKGEKKEAGKDFPAGIYDIHAVDGWTSVKCVIPLGTDYEDEEMNFRDVSRWLSAEDLDSTYRNMVLVEGATISPETENVELVPSAIGMESGREYYEPY